MKEEAIGLEEAIKQMIDDGEIPDGFHMMFFSEDFSLKEDDNKRWKRLIHLLMSLLGAW